MRVKEGLKGREGGRVVVDECVPIRYSTVREGNNPEQVYFRMTWKIFWIENAE